MASAPGPVVNPTWRLAGLALAQSENTQRRSTIGGERPNFKSPIKEHPPTLDEHDDENEMVFTNSEVVKSDNSSDVTLIEPEPKTPESSNHEKDDSNRMVVDSKEDEQNLEQNLQPGRPRADSGLEMEDDVPALVNPSPPSRPPPVPPRPQQPMIGPQNNPFATGNAESSWRQKAEAAANQQDVHEVMENILFKLECAIKPDAVVNETTEQTNAIKEYVLSFVLKLFY
jgi:ubiquitin carboxyl-terminal hydrolase 25/28